MLTSFRSSMLRIPADPASVQWPFEIICVAVIADLISDSGWLLMKSTNNRGPVWIAVGHQLLLVSVFAILNANILLSVCQLWLDCKKKFLSANISNFLWQNFVRNTVESFGRVEI